jgi:TusE/DsrC/DsvC family sulfur relay protein
MGGIKVAGKSVEVDEAGYLVNRSDWSEEVATAMARADGIELTLDHWEVINLARAYSAEVGFPPPMRKLVNAMRKALGLDKGSRDYLLKLFPSSFNKYAGLMRADGSLKYSPAVVSANRVHDAPLGLKHTMVLFDNIQAKGEIEYAFLLAVFEDATDELVYLVSSEVNAMASVFDDGSHYLCTFSGEVHGNLGGSDDWGDPEKFLPQAMRVAAEHFGVGPEEIGNQDEGRSAHPPELLNAAAVRGDIAGVKTLLAKGAAVNGKDSDGRTALMLASAWGRTAVVKALLDVCANVNARAMAGQTALIWASLEGHTEIVKMLLDKGADVNARDRGRVTALLAAARSGHAEIIEPLLDAGADVNASDRAGQTALISASAPGHTEAVKVLLSKGADVNAKDRNGASALTLATDKGHTEIVRLLKQAGARSA